MTIFVIPEHIKRLDSAHPTQAEIDAWDKADVTDCLTRHHALPTIEAYCLQELDNIVTEGYELRQLARIIYK